MSDKNHLEGLIGAECIVDLEHPLTKLNQAVYKLLVAVGVPKVGMVRSFVNPVCEARLDVYGGDKELILYTYQDVEFYPVTKNGEIQCYQIALMALGAYWRPELDSAFKDTLRTFSPDYPLPHPVNFGAPKGEQVSSIYLQLVKRLAGKLDRDMLLPYIEKPRLLDDALLTDYDRAAIAEQQALLNEVWEQIVPNPEAIARYHESGLAEPWWKVRD